jgi:hypothetical protein
LGSFRKEEKRRNRKERRGKTERFRQAKAGDRRLKSIGSNAQ